MGKRESYVWSLQRVVETDMGSWTARDEPLLTFSLKSAESVGPIDCEHGLEDVFQVNFKSGKRTNTMCGKCPCWTGNSCSDEEEFYDAEDGTLCCRYHPNAVQEEDEG